MKDLKDVDAKELKSVVKELNDSGLLDKKIRLVAISVQNMLDLFVKEVEALPEDAEVPQIVADFYNELFADEIDEVEDEVEEELEEDDPDQEEEELEEDDLDDDSDSDEDVVDEEAIEDGKDADDEDLDDDEDLVEDEDEPTPVPEPKKGKGRPKGKKTEPMKPLSEEQKQKNSGKKIPKPPKEDKPADQDPTLIGKLKLLVKKGSLDKTSKYLPIDIEFVKAKIANINENQKVIAERVIEMKKKRKDMKDITEDCIRREVTKINSVCHYVFSSFNEGKEKSKLNEALAMVLNSEKPKFVHSSTLIAIKRTLTAYATVLGLFKKEEEAPKKKGKKG